MNSRRLHWIRSKSHSYSIWRSNRHCGPAGRFVYARASVQVMGNPRIPAVPPAIHNFLLPRTLVESCLQLISNTGGLTDNEQAALSGKTLIVRIDEHTTIRCRCLEMVLMTWQPIQLARLSEVARQATGDSNGIRVRIQKRVTARASAEQKILLELEKVGIGKDAIFESSELVD